MNQIKKFITWLSKAWPFIAIIFTATVHFNILKVCRTVDVDTINQYISSFTQIIGGLIILFNINSNLGLFKQNDLANNFSNWLKSFPLFRKIDSTSMSGNVTLPGLICCAEGHTNRVCTTLEEKIEEAQRQIDELRTIVYRKERGVLKKITDTKKELKNLIYQNQTDINELNNLVSESTIGGINNQIFGILLVMYGAIFPLI